VVNQLERLVRPRQSGSLTFAAKILSGKGG
jgi:hypothetical protein